MKTIQLYDSPPNCAPGICGVEVLAEVVGLATTLSQLCRDGIRIECFNLERQPMAFVSNPTVMAVMEQKKADALPLFLLDGEILVQGRYPTRQELAAFCRAALGRERQFAAFAPP
jgi:hypothetical protein